MLDIRRTSGRIGFGGFTHVEPIADAQTGPTCGLEAVENIVQLFTRTNDSSAGAAVMARARDRKALVQAQGGFALDLRYYHVILNDFGISSRWYPFDHANVVIPALRSNRGVLVIGDAHRLNQQAYPKPDGNHAFVLTNYYTEESGFYVLGYVGIDSNFARTETVWPYQNVEAAVLWASRYVLPFPVLITDTPANWPSTARFYRLMQTGQLLPVL